MANWLGQTKEEFLEEARRYRALTPEQRKQELDEKMKEMEKKYSRPKKPEKTPLENAEWMYVNTDSSDVTDNSLATIYWIIAMVFGALFHARLLIWIVATAIWLLHIYRREYRQWEWNHGGKEKYLKEIDDINKGVHK